MRNKCPCKTLHFSVLRSHQPSALLEFMQTFAIQTDQECGFRELSIPHPSIEEWIAVLISSRAFARKDIRL